MQTKEDNSYGVIPLWRNGTDWEVLLVHQISYRGKDDTFWILPKGHAEGDETNEETARRELSEETGVTDVRLEVDTHFSMSYSFRHEGVMINKTVTYFIGYCDTKDTHISQPHEIKELKWVSFEKAKELLTHQNSKDILDSVITFLAIK